MILSNNEGDWYFDRANGERIEFTSEEWSYLYEAITGLAQFAEENGIVGSNPYVLSGEELKRTEQQAMER